MTQMSIARALTKLKTLDARISNNIRIIRSNAGINTKIISPLSNHKDLNKNQDAAKKEIASLIASTKDMINHYVTVKNTIWKANQEVKLDTPLGEITLATALAYAQDAGKYVNSLAEALSAAVAAAENSSLKYNKNRVENNTALTNIDASVIEALSAQPLVLFNPAELSEATEKQIYLKTELNMVINEVNATTLIEVPDSFTKL